MLDASLLKQTTYISPTIPSDGWLGDVANIVSFEAYADSDLSVVDCRFSSLKLQASGLQASRITTTMIQGRTFRFRYGHAVSGKRPSS